MLASLLQSTRLALRRMRHALRAKPKGTPEEVFTDIYTTNAWKDKATRSESRSGPGSSLVQTETLRSDLPRLLKELNCRSLLDAPCGDFHWMSRVELAIENYIGADIVGQLVDDNHRRFGGPGRTFLQLDLTRDKLPQVDVILVRDCLVHFPLADVQRTLAHLRGSGAKWLLTTTFTARKTNDEIPLGSWRPINLQAAPLNLPPARKLLNESCTQHHGQYADKCLGLWAIEDLPSA
jgi:hypothetical protein